MSTDLIDKNISLLPAPAVSECVRITYGSGLKSYFGGEPLVPQNFVWPETQALEKSNLDSVNLSHIASIFLEELPQFKGRELLPEKGLLQLWYDIDNQPWKKTTEAVRVFWYENTNDLQKATNVPEEVYFLKQASICFEKNWSVMSAMQMHDIGLIEREDFDRYDKITYGMHEEQQKISRLEHQMLGFPSDFQNQCVDPDRTLLFQIDSDQGKGGPGFCWGDTGILWVDISNEDLALRDFSGVASEWSCC